MAAETQYHKGLRTIGQALEESRVVAFDIKSSGTDYTVYGEAERVSSFRAVLQRLRDFRFGQKKALHLSFTPQQIEILEQRGRARRRAGGQIPDFYSTPNILRTVGSYLDLNGAHLVQLYKRGLTIMILYQTSDGHPKVEERSLASFYDLFLQLYQGRHKATSG
ncbi:MAG: hypothetical protein HYY46_14305 [Deltaproteobacteria bacterium]|nr:hypothetical protein [Deltaproteobacteria bacterium]